MRRALLCLAFATLAACSAQHPDDSEVAGPGSGTNVAGGQSGTESGGGLCVLEDAGIRSIALDEEGLGAPPSPNQVFALLEGTRQFTCETFWKRPFAGSEIDAGGGFGPIDFELEITRGTAARILMGQFFGSSAGPVECPKLEVDATVTLRANGETALRASKVRLEFDTFHVTRESGQLTLGDTPFELRGLELRMNATELSLSSPDRLSIMQCVAKNVVGPDDLCWTDSQCGLSAYDHDIETTADCTCSLVYSCSEDAVSSTTVMRRYAQANKICSQVTSTSGPPCINQGCSVPRRALCKSGRCEMDIGEHPDAGS